MEDIYHRLSEAYGFPESKYLSNAVDKTRELVKK